ncbi:MAG: DUF4270 family protein [Cryomorphaceae bacterium]|nr:DUF4270 family protein [Cryomorphaceae bacterium]
MNRIISLSLIIGLIAASCTDSNTIGLEVQPTSDNIIISSANFEGISSATESEDSLRTDEALNLILGEIDDPVFGYDRGSFFTQVLLTENNIDLGDYNDLVIDSSFLSYTYSGYYGDINEFNKVSVHALETGINNWQGIFKDSIYYSNFSDWDAAIGDWAGDFTVTDKDSENPMLKIKLHSYPYVDDFLNAAINLGENHLVDNEAFLKYFLGFYVYVNQFDSEQSNTMLYLNPSGSNSKFSIYYHDINEPDSVLTLDFSVDGDAARINYFDEIFDDPLQQQILEDTSRIYIQSMANFKTKIIVGDLAVLKDTLKGKAVNKVTMSFDVEAGSTSEYAAHDKLFLVRVNEEGNNVFLTDYTIEGETHFGGRLEDDKYEFNITRYFYQLLNNDAYTNDLYLLPAGAAVNANRTILNKDIKLTIHYSEL